MMKRNGRSERDLSGRVMCRRLAVVWEERVWWSGGTKTPSWRKERTLDMRRRDEAEGERRMMGSDRLDETALAIGF